MTTIDGTEPKISIILPAYNAEKYIEETIFSVIQQNYKNIELVICDDGSTDKTYEIIRSINDHRIVTLRNGQNMGVSFTRDKAISVASGDFITFIDADDCWLPSRLRKLISVLATSPNSIVFDDVYDCHDTPNGLVPWSRIWGENAFGCDGQSAVKVPAYKYIQSHRLLMQPILSRELILKYNIKHSPHSFWEDVSFVLDLLSKGIELIYLPEPLYLYRITPGSATGQKDRDNQKLDILNKTLLKFGNAPHLVSAIRTKIKMVEKDKTYMKFLWKIKEKNFYEGFRIYFRNPWVIKEFHTRFKKDIIYNLHRIRHGGKKRGIR